MNARDFLLTKVRASLGDPILAALPTELGAMDSAIRLAALKYWTACPYIYQAVIIVDVSDAGQYILNVPDLISAAFTNAAPGVSDMAYYLGVRRVSDATFGTSVRSFDSWLLGVPIGSDLGNAYGSSNFTIGTSVNAPNVIDYDRMNLDATNFSAMTGRVEYKLDRVQSGGPVTGIGRQGIIIFTMPSYYGQVTVEHGFGFDDPNCSFIEMSHFDIFSRLVMYEFLDIVIQARTSIELQGDFRINTTELMNRRQALQQSVAKDLSAISPIPMLWG